MNKVLRIAVVFHPNAPLYQVADDQLGYDPEDIYFGPLLRGISEILSDTPAEVVYARVAPGQYGDYARQEGVDGLILLAVRLTELSVLRELVTPYVVLGSSPGPQDALLPCVDASNIEAGTQGATYLISLGHQRLGCVNFAADFTNHADRMQGFELAAIRAGYPIDPRHMLTDFGYRREQFNQLMDEWLRSLIDSGDLPTAIFACDYAMAQATLDGLRRNGIIVPGSVSLLGVDDPPGARNMTPPLSTISQPVIAMGRRAAERLLEALSDPAGPRQLVGPEYMPTTLIERQSTAPPVGSMPKGHSSVLSI